MPRLNAPLFSLRAHGTLDGNLVYQAHPGAPRVVKHSTPTGPLSSAQTAQRQRYSDLSAAWTADHPPTADLTAWRLYASLFSPNWSPFNVFLHEALPVLGAGETWLMMNGADPTNFNPTLWQARILNAGIPSAPTIHWGTSPTLTPNSAIMVFASQWWNGPPLTRSPGGVDYWWCDFTDPAVEYGRTGVLRTPPIA